MKTKLFIFTIAFTIATSLTFGQSTESSKTSFGILGGVNFQNLNGKDASGDKLKNDMIIGYHVGVNVQFPIAPEFYFQPGLMFSTKGAKSEFTFLGVTSTNTYKLSYIELPLNLVYKAQVGSGYVMLGFGPYVAYGIGGKHINEIGSLTNESSIKFKNETDLAESLSGNYVKPFDAGANILFGYEMASGIFIQLNAQLGMLNINPKNNPENDATLKNTGFGLSLGYRL